MGVGGSSCRVRSLAKYLGNKHLDLKWVRPEPLLALSVKGFVHPLRENKISWYRCAGMCRELGLCCQGLQISSKVKKLETADAKKDNASFCLVFLKTYRRRPVAQHLGLLTDLERAKSRQEPHAREHLRCLQQGCSQVLRGLGKVKRGCCPMQKSLFFQG